MSNLLLFLYAKLLLQGIPACVLAENRSLFGRQPGRRLSQNKLILTRESDFTEYSVRKATRKLLFYLKNGCQ